MRPTYEELEQTITAQAKEIESLNRLLFAQQETHEKEIETDWNSYLVSEDERVQHTEIAFNLRDEKIKLQNGGASSATYAHYEEFILNVMRERQKSIKNNKLDYKQKIITQNISIAKIEAHIFELNGAKHNIAEETFRRWEKQFKKTGGKSIFIKCS